jgi:hypothetical protein
MRVDPILRCEQDQRVMASGERKAARRGASAGRNGIQRGAAPSDAGLETSDAHAVGSVEEERAPRPRVNAAHLATEYIDEFGQTVDMRVPQDLTDAGSPTGVTAIFGAAKP